MLINIYKNSLLLLIILITSCIEPFSIDESKLKEALVVEGMITNDPGPYKIYLSKTTSATDPRENPFTEANVKIMDDLGFAETLTQIDPGKFVTDSLGIRGIVGRKYKIIIESFAGKTYESEYTELREAIPIDDFYFNQEINHDHVHGIDKDGYRFYTKLQPYTEKNTYLLWLSEETYMYEAPYSIDYVWIGYIHEYEYPDTFKTCWITGKVKEIITLANDIKRNQQPITVTLNHTDLNKFAIKYSLLLKQFSVDEETNKYWKAVNDMNEGQNSFYNQQPYQIKGNIQNTDDPKETVLGFFFAAGISKKRIFQSHLGLQTYYYCTPDYRAMRFIHYMPESTWPLWIVDVTGTGALARAEDHCFDCRLKGGTIEKPNFWE